VCKPTSKGLAGRPRIRWENDIKEDLRVLKTNNWTKLIYGGVKWKEVVERSRTLKQ
jgi:hypothetical protein